MKKEFNSKESCAVVVAAVVSMATVSLPADTPNYTPRDSGNIQAAVSLALVDDLTGPELQAKHGIAPTTIDDLSGLIQAAVDGKVALRIGYFLIDEDASDGPLPVVLSLSPFDAVAPVPPNPNAGALADLQKRLTDYIEARRHYHQQLVEFRARVGREIEAFCRSVLAVQAATAERFDQEVRRRGADYNRSDVAGVLISAARFLGASGGTLVINSDCQDEPGSRPPRIRPFDENEVPARIEWIFVNRSRQPEAAGLFRGMSGLHHADAVQEAFRMIQDRFFPTPNEAQ